MKREEAIKILSEELKNMIIQLLDNNLRSCINCNFFNQENEICCKFNARPPAKIIAKSCEKWEFDTKLDIPF